MFTQNHVRGAAFTQLFECDKRIMHSYNQQYYVGRHHERKITRMYLPSFDLSAATCETQLKSFNLTCADLKVKWLGC